MLQIKKFAGLGMFICLICCFSLVHGNNFGKKYDEEEGRAYLKKINAGIQVKTTESVLASWAYESNITDENLRHQLDVSAKLANYTKEIWKETIKYPWKTFKDPDVRRQFQKFSVLGTAILSPPKYERFNKIISDMQSVYGKAKICNYHNRTNCSLQLEPELTEIFVKSRDPDELRYYWEQWRDVAGKPVRKMYKEYVDLSNEAAVLNNFTDNAEFWLKDYEAKDFKQQVEALWEQLRPLYLQLHAYVRRRLREQYGEKHVTKRGPIPAHLLGNMWAQSWGNIFDFTAPYPGKPSMDVTPSMVEQGYTPLRMFKLAEEFFTSLNLSPMPDTFWKNSILEKPNDGRDLICHASAWDFYDGKDFRIKQCTRNTMEDLNTVHHEMGHIQYFLQYKNQPLVYKEGTNPGFHEAVGDVMALSVSTPKHLRKIGLLNATQDDAESEINQLFSMALDKIAFLPFGYLMDQWRWSVFEGQTTEREYNCKWWQLREKYQGLSPSVIRTEDDFDPGAKYHTVGNVPYIRYFVSFVIQFQFHRSLCIAANEFDPNDPLSKPLHKCDIYQSKEAGALLKKMLQMGSSKPWPDAMEVMTGQRKMDARPLLEYFAALQSWLEKENKKTGEFIGWESSRKECKWEEAGEAPVAKSLTAQGNFEDDNIAYSYAEFVRQDDNTFGFPDYLEEIRPFYHSFRHRLKKKEFPPNYFVSNKKPRSFSVPNNLYLTAGSYPQDDNNIKQPKSKRLDSVTEQQNSQTQNQRLSNVGAYKIFNFPVKLPNRKQKRDSDKTKLLNAILQELRDIKDNKISGKTYKNIFPREVSSDQKSLESNEENLPQKSEPLNESAEKSQLENKEEEMKFSSDKSDNSASANSDNSVEFKVEALTEKIQNDDKAEVPLNTAKASEHEGLEKKAELGNVEKNMKVENVERKSEVESVEKSSETVNAEGRSEAEGGERKSEIPNADRRLDLENAAARARNELLWKAELVKSEAERMLKNFNLSSHSQDGQNYEVYSKSLYPDTTVDTTNTNSETPCVHSNDKKTRNVLPSYENFYRGRTENVKFNPFESFLNPLRSDGRRKKNSDLLKVTPTNSLTSGKKNVRKSISRKRSAQKSTNSDLTYVLLVGNVPGKQTPNLGFTRRKKSYKEYHYNVKTPVVYNAVVITPGGKPEKSDDAKNNWAKINKRLAKSLEPENGSRVLKSKRRRRSYELLVNRLSSSVKNNKDNISNIVQYFGCLQLLL